MFKSHLHAHSCFSFMEATPTPEEIAKKSAEYGYTAAAITDSCGLYGVYRFYNECIKLGIKPIIGTELLLEQGGIIVIVKNAKGYANLCELLTTAHLSADYGEKPIISLGLIERYSQGLIFLTGHALFGMVEKETPISVINGFVKNLKKISNDLYIELFMHKRKDYFTCEKLKQIARQNDISLVCTNAVNFIDKQDLNLQNVLSAAGNLTTVDRANSDKACAEQYFKSPWEMEELFEDFSTALANVSYITGQIDFKLPGGKFLYPKVYAGEKYSEYSLLWSIAYEGLVKRYNPITKQALDRLNYEISVIHSMGYTGYFLIVYDIVEYAKSQNIPAVGRGSAGDSLVSYCLGITNVDPIKHNLYFERFLHPERKSPPDIDIDLCWKNRDKVIDYVFKKYGKEKCAMIAAFVTFQSRSSFRDVAKAYGLSQAEVNGLTKKLPSHGGLDMLDKRMKQLSEYADFPAGLEEFKNFIDTGKRLTDLPRHISVHPCGMVISPDTIYNRVPLQKAAKGVIVTQYDMHDIESAGLLKIDLLGVRGLSVFYDTIRLLKKRGITVDIDSIPLDDKETYSLISAGQTMGCFQIESPAMRGLLRNLKPKHVEGIIQAVAHIRPGPTSGGLKDAFIRRFNGLEKTEYIHPALEPVLKETYGVVVYQEQVLKIANVIAGLSMAQSESIRRSMTKFKGSRGMEKNRDIFVSGAIQRGFEESVAVDIWNQIVGFAQYGFNKAHSATYGYLGYKSAFLKCHYPGEFMTAVLLNNGGFYPRMAYAEEARRLNIPLLYPDVMKSGEDFTLTDNGIMPGLGDIQHISKPCVKAIIEERSIKAFVSLYDFVIRVKPDVREFENLVKSGALSFSNLKKTEQMLIGRMALKGVDYSSYRCEQDYTLAQDIENELLILNMAVSAHPLAMLREKPGHVPAVRLRFYEGKCVHVMGIIVAYRRTVTKGKKYMKFVSIMDETGIIECVLFPEVYKKFGRETRGGGIIRVYGVVENDFDKITVTARKIEKIFYKKVI